jgi:hypothetical protein
VTSVVTRTSAAPSSFALVFFDAASTSQYGYLSTPSDRPGSSGTLITFKQDQISRNNFALNAQKQLTTKAGDLVTGKNTRDPFPYLFLDNVTTPANTPKFSVCDNALRADYPDTQGNGFALCDGFLSLGVDSVFTESCQRIDLKFGEVPISDGDTGDTLLADSAQVNIECFFGGDIRSNFLVIIAELCIGT